MCIAIFKPANKVIPEEYLRSSWTANPDGAGFCYVKDGKIVVDKDHMTVKDFLSAYDKAYKRNKNSPFLIHFRIRSMGDKGKGHTHPYLFDHGALIHNGTIHGSGAVYGSGPSDTELFALKLGKWMVYEYVEKYKKEIEDALDWNKVVLLYPDKRHIILNESKGTWDDGVWYSTSAYKSGRGVSCPT